MARNRMYVKRRSRVPEISRYNQKTLHHDREYGFYWYSWLWKFFRPVLVLTCALVIVLGIMASGWNFINRNFFMPVDPGSTQTVDFTIDKGSSITVIGEKLYSEGLLRNKGVFKYIIQFQGLTNKIQYGEYPLSPSMDVNQIIAALTAGSASNERSITIIPGWTAADIVKYLRKQGVLTSKTQTEFVELLNNLSYFEEDYYALQDAAANGLEGRRYQLEGYLAPDTYRVYTNATPETVLRTLLHQTDAVIDSVFNAEPETEVLYDELGQRIDPEAEAAAAAEDAANADGEQPDATPEPDEPEVRFSTTLNRDQTIILASIIEKEAAKKEDYARVSAVFHNRLERGMSLESDATVAYPLGVHRIVLTADELNTVNGYNTYTRKGLPVGPICNPSKAAIQAALYPNTEYIYDGYLYFCAGDPEKGELFFSRTASEHEAYVAQYRSSWVAYDKKQARSEEAGDAQQQTAQN